MKNLTVHTATVIALISAITGGAHADGVLWDNGDTNGVNGVSHLSDPYRSILDDFVVDGGGWLLTGFDTVGLWDSGGIGLGEGLDLTIWSNDPAGGDSEKGPGEPILTLGTRDYTETPTGRSWFGLQEAGIHVNIEPFALGSGKYWLEMHVRGPENFYQMVKDGDLIRENPLWTNYSDLGFGPGQNIFGDDYDTAFVITGVPIPAPGSLALLGLAGLNMAGRRRR